MISGFFGLFVLMVLFFKGPRQHCTPLQEITQVLRPNLVRQLPQFFLHLFKHPLWLHQEIPLKSAYKRKRDTVSAIEYLLGKKKIVNIFMASNLSKCYKREVDALKFLLLFYYSLSATELCFLSLPIQWI